MLATGTDLDFWSESLDARSQLPRLVRRLIYASVPNVLENDFRADEGIGVPGWDGKVSSPTITEFVPNGISCWELSTSSDLPGNAQENYRKRTSNPLGADPGTSTFVYVTTRRWRSGLDEWIAKRKEDNAWSDVRVYDADRLESWLETAPVVHTWLSRMLGRIPEGAKDLETYWTEWSQLTRPPFSTALATAGRAEAAEQVLAWVSANPELLTLRAETEKEAISFIAAVAQELPEDDRDRIFARAVVLDTSGAWELVTFAASPAIAISQLPDRQTAPAAVGRGHHVLIPLSRDHPSDRQILRLPSVDRDAAKNALEEMGHEANAAAEDAELAWRGLQILQRKLAVSRAVLTPDWAQPPAGRILVPAVLAGGWDESNVKDREILASWSAQEYGQWRPPLVDISDQSDAPVRRIGGRWFAVARADSWSLLAHYMEEDQLQRFHDSAVEVLRERDPKFELPAKDRFAASVHGKVLDYSLDLRRGICETIGLLSALDGVQGVMSGPLYARWVVKDIFEETDWMLWASLGGELALLAEASPDEFMDAIERDIKTSPEVIQELFREDQSLFSGEPGVGLLWALETLSWSVNHFPRASTLLAALDEVTSLA